MDEELYRGRKGQRRLRAIEKHIDRIREEFDISYESAPEMIFLADEAQWEGTGKLIFTMAQRNVSYRWNSMMDYGFIRLCFKWIKEKNVVMDAENTARMIRDILPEKMCGELSEELSAIEIS